MSFYCSDHFIILSGSIQGKCCISFLLLLYLLCFCTKTVFLFLRNFCVLSTFNNSSNNNRNNNWRPSKICIAIETLFAHFSPVFSLSLFFSTCYVAWFFLACWLAAHISLSSSVHVAIADIIVVLMLGSVFSLRIWFDLFLCDFRSPRHDFAITNITHTRKRTLIRTELCVWSNCNY